MRLRDLVVAGVRLRRRLLDLGRRWSAAEPKTLREITRSRIESILQDQSGPAVQDPESPLAGALEEARERGQSGATLARASCGIESPELWRNCERRSRSVGDPGLGRKSWRGSRRHFALATPGKRARGTLRRWRLHSR